MICAEAARMYRCISTQAIVIRRERYGEFHKSLSLLTSDLGLISATAYGAYKMHSRLRMGSEPFTWSRTLLYHNPVKHSYKVTDMEIRGSFSGLQADLSRVAAASLWAEVVQKSYGAGETSDMLFHLFRESLALLESADARREPYVTLQFLWRFLSLAGYQPDLASCDNCGTPIGDTQPVHYSGRANAVLCADCGSQLGNPLPAGALRYLEATQALALDRAVDVQLEPAGLRALRGALPRMVQSVLEGELASLPWVGAGR
jgi:DNA repair protein RecO (recombination protein O)